MSTGGNGGGGNFKGMKYREVTRAHPCPVCGADSWCSTFDRGVKCMRCTAGANHVATDKRGQEYGLYFNGAAPPGFRPPREPEPPPAPIASERARAAVYLAMVYALTLSPAHRDQLLRRGLNEREIDLREYRTLSANHTDRARALEAARAAAAEAGEDLDTVPGFYRGGVVGAAGLLIPVRDVGASILAFKVRRDVSPGDASASSAGSSGSKYVWFSSRSEARPDGPSPGALTHVPLVSLRAAVTLPAGDLGVLRITEGPLKADIATAITGVRTVGIPGASIIRDVVALARGLHPQPRAVRLAWDSDASVAPAQREPTADGPAAGRMIRRRNHVALSLEQCAHALARELPSVGLEVETWESERSEQSEHSAAQRGAQGSSGAKGIDDALVARVPITVHRDDSAWVELHRVVSAGGESPGRATCERAGLAPPPTPPAPPTIPTGPFEDRPVIVVQTRRTEKQDGRVTAATVERVDVPTLAAAGLAALARTTWGASVFSLENSNPPCMVHVIQTCDDAEHGHAARAGIVATTRNVLRGWFSGAARWVSEGGGKSGNEAREADPPDPVVAFAQESCESVRPLRGLVEAPVMRRDGTIISAPGYDAATRLFAAFDADAAAAALATIPDVPTKADARASLDILHKLVCDFPFEKPAHRATWVAGLLTMLAREMFDGPAPLFLARANTRGSGKTLLTELPHIIACGDRPAMLGWSGDEVEFEKQVTTEAIAGSACVVIDNITGTLKSATLDRILTSGKHRARILGGNQKFDGPMRAVWWASGNNLDTSDDMASRRIAPIELVATDARPEDRSGFTADAVEESEEGGSGETGTAALRAYARRNRWHLVSAAMTILRAWHCAGRPVPRDLSAWGSFESWSRVVRGALIFAGDVDPGEAHAEFRDAASVDVGQLRGLLDGWADATAAGILSPSGETLARAIKRLAAEHAEASAHRRPARGALLREALEAVGGGEPPEKWHAPTIGRVGKWFRANRRKVANTSAGPRILDASGESGGSVRWVVRAPVSGATQGGRVPGASTMENEQSPQHPDGAELGGMGGRGGMFPTVPAKHPFDPCHGAVGNIPPIPPIPPGMDPSEGFEASESGHSDRAEPSGAFNRGMVPRGFDDDDLPPVTFPFGDGSDGSDAPEVG